MHRSTETISTRTCATVGNVAPLNSYVSVRTCLKLQISFIQKHSRLSSFRAQNGEGLHLPVVAQSNTQTSSVQEHAAMGSATRQPFLSLSLTLGIIVKLLKVSVP
jgi:hypothetical protein